MRIPVLALENYPTLGHQTIKKERFFQHFYLDEELEKLLLSGEAKAS